MNNFGVLLGAYFLSAALVGEHFQHSLPLTVLLTLGMALPFVRQEKSSWVLVFVSLLMVLDVALILARHGMEVGYFRSPMQSDPERNVAVVNALLRGGMSPFYLSELVYQTTWHHGVAALHHYPVTAKFVDMFSVFTAFAYFFVLLSFIRERKSWAPSIALIVLAWAHADVYNIILYQAIEADGGITHWASMFSPKLTAVTSPQHLLFCLFLILLVHTKDQALEKFFAVMCVVVSPVLSAITLSGYYIEKSIHGDWRKERNKVLIILAVSFLVYLIIYHRLPLHDVFGRSYRKIEFFKTELWYVPFVWVANLGAIGIAVTYAILKKPKQLYGLWLIWFLLLFNFIAVDSELRRQYSIVASTIAIIFLASIEWSKAVRYLVVTSAVIAIPAHGFFLYRFLAGPNILSQPLSDYLCMNDYLSKHPLPVIASSGELRFPPAVRVTTIFQPNREDILTHSRLNKPERHLLKDGYLTYENVLLNDSRGYSGFILGPFEKEAWSGFMPQPLKNELLHTCGSVSLYRFTD